MQLYGMKHSDLLLEGLLKIEYVAQFSWNYNHTLMPFNLLVHFIKLHFIKSLTRIWAKVWQLNSSNIVPPEGLAEVFTQIMVKYRIQQHIYIPLSQGHKSTQAVSPMHCAVWFMAVYHARSAEVNLPNASQTRTVNRRLTRTIKDIINNLQQKLKAPQ